MARTGERTAETGLTSFFSSRQQIHDGSGRLLQSLLALIAEFPSLPRNTVSRALRVAARLPSRAQPYAFRMIAGKLAHDFALRFLLSLGDVSRNSKRAAAIGEAFDLTDPVDAAHVAHLVEMWSELPRNLSIRTAEDLWRFINVTGGLQIMMEGVPAERMSWIFDCGAQYRHLLLDAGVLPEGVVIAHTWTGQVGRERAVELRAIPFSYDPSATAPMYRASTSVAKRLQEATVTDPELPAVRPFAVAAG